jgi:Fe-S oxidoreductase
MAIDTAAGAAAERCLYCPKLCRFSCPVAHESARETLTPWGKMTLLSLSATPSPVPFGLPGRLETLARKAREAMAPVPVRALDADAAEAFYACTGCRRCSTWCEHGNDVPHALYQGRAMAVWTGLAPAGARAVADRFARVGHAQSGDVAAAIDRLASEQPPENDASSVFFAGCEAPLTSPGSVTAALAAARRLGAPLGLARGTVCCGRPLFEAGYRDAFRDHVREVWGLLGDREVVLPSAACARALTEWSQEVGVEPQGSVLHISTYLARRLGPHVQARPLPITAIYHDPCHLGRGLGEYEAPRRLLGAALSGGVKEAASHRETSDCCGGSGLLGRTYPEVARAMAMTRADELRDAGAGQIVTSCPSCQESLRAAGLQVRDLAEVVASWLGGEGGKAVTHS